jgi:hypothetical protein
VAHRDLPTQSLQLLDRGELAIPALAIDPTGCESALWGFVNRYESTFRGKSRSESTHWFSSSFACATRADASAPRKAFSFSSSSASWLPQTWYPGADVAGVSPIPLQVGPGGVESPCGTNEPSPGADVPGVSPVSVQMWHG